MCEYQRPKIASPIRRFSSNPDGTLLRRPADPLLRRHVPYARKHILVFHILTMKSKVTTGRRAVATVVAFRGWTSTRHPRVSTSSFASGSHLARRTYLHGSSSYALTVGPVRSVSRSGGRANKSNKCGALSRRPRVVRVEALFESFCESSITSILLGQNFARDFGSLEVRRMNHRI